MMREILVMHVFLFVAIPAIAGEPSPALQSAIERGLRLTVKAAANYPNHRKCFSCHHQTLPLLTMVSDHRVPDLATAEARDAVVEFTHRSFHGRLDRLKEGTGIGGAAFTVAYGLWTFELVDRQPDETSDAMVTYLLKTQRDDGAWKFQTRRPPLESSLVTTTVLTAYGLQQYAREEQQEAAQAAITKAAGWLSRAEAPESEDRAFRLWGLKLLGADGRDLQLARQAVLSAQREDGGWSQKDDMSSDAYATGQALWMLHETGTPTSSKAYQGGLAWLLAHQLEDGSWRIETRSKPVQTFFDNGDPHGKHQFISMAATCWAVAALVAGRSEDRGAGGEDREKRSATGADR